MFGKKNVAWDFKEKQKKNQSAKGGP